MLPILTFDERKLTPSFGYFFDARWLEPYESIVGVLWKFACMNGLAGHVVVTQLCRQPVGSGETAPTARPVCPARRVRLLLDLASV
jgi:hypothetical protein